MESCLRAVTSSEVLANTVYQSACATPDIQHFVPLSTQSSPSRTALVRMPITSLPACGSDRPNAARCVPVGDRREVALPAAPPTRRSGPGPVGSRVSSSISAAVFEYLATSSMARVRPMIPAPPPPQLLRDAQPEQAGVAEDLEQVLGVLAGLVDLPGPGLHLVLGDLAAGLPAARQLLGELEVHAPDRTRGTAPASPQERRPRRPVTPVRVDRTSSPSRGWRRPVRRASSAQSPRTRGPRRSGGRARCARAPTAEVDGAPLRVAHSPKLSSSASATPTSR